MAKARTKTDRSAIRATDWNVGQPLVFPAVKPQTNIKRLAREAVEEGLRGPSTPKREKRKKK
jgi:hypothetical protein